MNLLPCVVETQGAERVAKIERKAGSPGDPIQLRLPELVKAPAGVELMLGLRPEAFSEKRSPSDHATVRTRIILVEPTGPENIILFDLAGHEAVARIGTGEIAKTGDAEFAVDMRKPVFFDKDFALRIQ